jgi:hypothetical protein
VRNLKNKERALLRLVVVNTQTRFVLKQVFWAAILGALATLLALWLLYKKSFRCKEGLGFKRKVFCKVTQKYHRFIRKRNLRMCHGNLFFFFKILNKVAALGNGNAAFNFLVFFDVNHNEIIRLRMGRESFFLAFHFKKRLIGARQTLRTFFLVRGFLVFFKKKICSLQKRVNLNFLSGLNFLNFLILIFMFFLNK